MYGVEIYRRIRISYYQDGLSQREIARLFGVNRRTVSKALLHAQPPGYRRSKPSRKPKLGPFTGIIDHILEEDRAVHKKQRHTAKRIFERLKAEHGFDGGVTIVKDYIQEVRQRSAEMFVPLSHDAGHAQADFGEAVAVIGGIEQKVHFLVVDLPHSDAIFVKAYPRETSEAFCDGHNAAFAFFGGVPLSFLYDNTKLWFHAFYPYSCAVVWLPPTPAEDRLTAVFPQMGPCPAKPPIARAAPPVARP